MPRDSTVPETREPLTLLRASRLLEMGGWVSVSDTPIGGVGRFALRSVTYEHGAGDLRAGVSLISVADDRDPLSDVSFWAYRQPESSKDPALEFLCREMVRLIPDSAEALVRLRVELKEAPFDGLIPHRTATATTASGWQLILMDYRRTYGRFKEGDSPLLFLDASR